MISAHKIYKTFHLSVLTIFVCYFFLFYGASGSAEAEGEGRVDQILLIFLVSVFAITNCVVLLRLKHSSVVRGPLSYSLFFIALWILYALFFLLSNPINRVLAYLPTIIFVLSSFSYFYFISYRSYLNLSGLKALTIALLGISCYNFYLTISRKILLLGDDFYTHSNNAGYGFVVILPLVMYSFRSNHVLRHILLALSYGCILFSSKRGAILIGSIILGIYLFILVRNQQRTVYKILYSVFVLIVLIGLFFVLQDSLDNILYRFGASGGSGRDLMYEAILDSILSGDLTSLLFGHGFFSTSEVTRSVLGVSQMAHSDPLEVMHDIGLLGITFYILLITKFLKLTSAIKGYDKKAASILLLCLILWLLKMLISGVIVSKVAVFIFLTMGVIVGNHFKQVHKNV